MANKQKLQDAELDAVSGGGGKYGTLDGQTCKKCGQEFIAAEARHTCEFVKNGCFDYTKYYICPFCGYRWKA